MKAFRYVYLTVLLASMCVGATLAVTPAAGGSQNAAWNGDVTIGWQFTLSSAVTVNELGFFDADSDGLSDDHPVGIFDSGGTLLISATVPAGSGATLQDGFRLVPVAPLNLAPGSYTIGGFGLQTSPDAFRFGVSGSTTIPGLTLDDGVQSSSAPGLSFPTQVNTFAMEGYFGPNFTVDAVIPEPSTAVLALSAFALAFFARRYAASRR
jgi:hypothetical protein